MLYELIGPANAYDRNSSSHLLERLNDCGSKAAHLHMIFKGDESGDAAGIEVEHFAIDGFDEARIDHGGREAFALQALSELLSHGDHGAEAENGNVCAVGDDLSLAYG